MHFVCVYSVHDTPRVLLYPSMQGTYSRVPKTVGTGTTDDTSLQTRGSGPADVKKKQD